MEKFKKERERNWFPHDLMAERAIAGCCMSDSEVVPRVLEFSAIDPDLLEAPRLPDEEERFEKKRPPNRTAIYHDHRVKAVMGEVFRRYDAGQAPDIIAVQAGLQARGLLEQIGGLAWLSECQDLALSVANLPTWLDVVWEKFRARQEIWWNTQVAKEIEKRGELNAAMSGWIAQFRERYERLTRGRGGSPEFLRDPRHFQSAVLEHFMAPHDSDGPGLILPIDFKFRIRPQETTLLSGDDGAGKSTVLGYFAAHLSHAADVADHPSGFGKRFCVASLEMPPHVTLWILMSQLLGEKKPAPCSENMAVLGECFDYLAPRCLIYDFLGIGDWKNILETFRYAAEKEGVTVFILDSVMRVGIADDDYAQQGQAAAAFAQFAKQFNSHLFYVIHENKSGAGAKGSIRGSKLWTANTDNVVRIEINHDKGSKEEDFRNLREVKIKEGLKKDSKEIEKLDDKIRAEVEAWDTKISLFKQRYPGTQQNASRRVWFNPQNFQYRLTYDAPRARNYLHEWTGSGELVSAQRELQRQEDLSVDDDD